MVITYTSKKDTVVDDTLFEQFKNPPPESRPFVRWWWNGNHISKEEIYRQLKVLSKAGFGGVEVNPIEMPEGAKDIGTRPVEWLSKEWNDLLVYTSKVAHDRNMLVDLIVGSGWPFGGEFLEGDDIIQRVLTHSIPVKEGTCIKETANSLISQLTDAYSKTQEKVPVQQKIMFITLVPETISGIEEVIDLSEELELDGSLDYEVPSGNYELVYGVLQKGFRNVMHGALGASGSVMDHYNKEVTLAYLERLKKITEDTGMPLSKLLRALFCDSIELAGANWTDNFLGMFEQTYGYRLEPYYPFIFTRTISDNKALNRDSRFQDRVLRVRYDYYKLLVRVFLDNFTKVFQEFCAENNLKSRYQAYGIPYLMGMTEGNMIADIPESNNWIYSANMNDDQWKWNQGHGYMIWNLYAAAGGHLTGKPIVSSEAMTNTKGVFKTSLEEIKQHDDMNFITGITHSILHGYNFSPVEAGFPGWIRYGSYFSEQNPWWSYLSNWTDYNARLSSVFQNSQPVKKIALIGPLGDIWSMDGLQRTPFHTRPWYFHRLWEPISNLGSSFEYINEKILWNGKVSEGSLQYGLMEYKAIIVSDVTSVDPRTLLVLEDYVISGGKLLFLDQLPRRSLSATNDHETDSIIKNGFDSLLQNYPQSVFLEIGPERYEDLLTWMTLIFEKSNLEKDVDIANPFSFVYQIHQQYKKKDIYFFANTSRKKAVDLIIKVPLKGRSAYRWNPEEATRTRLQVTKKSEKLVLPLNPLESFLLVVEPKVEECNIKPLFTQDVTNSMVANKISGSWKIRFAHMNGLEFEKEFETLKPFGFTTNDSLDTFAGTIFYSTIFTANGTEEILQLEEVNRGISEVFLNGKKIGINWYGQPYFQVKEAIKKGENQLEIKHTTVLSNYARSLTDDPVANRWTATHKPIQIGLQGDVLLYGR